MGGLVRMPSLPSRALRIAICALAFTLVACLVTSTQAYAAGTATVYNPLSLSNTVVTNDRVGHAVTFFQNWTNRFAIDIATSPESIMYPDREVYLWGVGWSTANVGTGVAGNNAHVGWTSYSDSACTVARGTEYAVGYLLNLPNGQSAGFSISHLSNYHQAEGALVSQGQQVGNLSWLSRTYGPQYALDINSVCFQTATAPHLHIESARTGTTTYNDVDPATGPSGSPSWYYNYP
jgi:hypothetical protein